MGELFNFLSRWWRDGKFLYLPPLSLASVCTISPQPRGFMHDIYPTPHQTMWGDGDMRIDRFDSIAPERHQHVILLANN